MSFHSDNESSCHKLSGAEAASCVTRLVCGTIGAICVPTCCINNKRHPLMTSSQMRALKTEEKSFKVHFKWAASSLLASGNIKLQWKWLLAPLLRVGVPGKIKNIDFLLSQFWFNRSRKTKLTASCSTAFLLSLSAKFSDKKVRAEL